MRLKDIEPYDLQELENILIECPQYAQPILDPTRVIKTLMALIRLTVEDGRSFY